MLTLAANGTLISVQTGSRFPDEDFILRKVTPGLFNWWQKNSGDPVNERSSSLQFQVAQTLPSFLQTCVDGLGGAPHSPGPRPSLESWDLSTCISVLVIFYCFVLLASIKTVTIFYYCITAGDYILNSNAYLSYLILLY